MMSLVARLRMMWHAWTMPRARGVALDRIAAVYGLKREPRERWWLIGDRRLRRRVVDAMRGIRRYAAGEPLKAGQMVALGDDGRVYRAGR